MVTHTPGQATRPAGRRQLPQGSSSYLLITVVIKHTPQHVSKKAVGKSRNVRESHLFQCMDVLATM
jgi:hypothetical protein